MKLKAYAKINFILNVLGTRPDGYHEVETLMQAISLCDIVTVENAGTGCLKPEDFEYREKDLAYRAALLMAERFCPERIKGAKGYGSARSIKGIRVSVEKHIPAAAGLGGGSSDAAAVMIGLAKLWRAEDAGNELWSSEDAGNELSSAGRSDDALLQFLLPLGAKLGSDVPFCIASQLGRPAAIARGTGTQLEFVQSTDCAVTLYESDMRIPDKTRAVYMELSPEDCTIRFDIGAFLSAGSIAEKRVLMGNHLQSPAERLMKRPLWIPEGAMLCGAGPTYFEIASPEAAEADGIVCSAPTGGKVYRTVLK